MKYIWLALPLVLGLAACSKVDDGSQKDSPASVRGAQADRDTPPGIDPSVTPGVAFDFRYGFSLPERRISTVQEQHAALCGRLGQLHCRVTALTFDKVRDGVINANMKFKLDPAMALGFARDATALVEQAEGKLATSRVEGTDVGKDVVANDKTSGDLRAELSKVDAQRRIPGLSKDARERLLSKGSEIRKELFTLSRDRDEKVESLATTPVVFEYEVIRVATTPGDALKQGLAAGSSSASALFAMLSLLLGAVGPWALLFGGGWWIFRRLRRHPVAATRTPMP
jgi:hypothetical protein